MVPDFLGDGSSDARFPNPTLGGLTAEHVNQLLVLWCEMSAFGILV